MQFSSLIVLGSAFGATTAMANEARPVGNPISKRQASEIPPNSLSLIEWWPKGCGNGGGRTLNGGEETLGACVNTESLWDEAPADSAAVRFLFPDDGREFKWKLFGTNNCSEQIAMGTKKLCNNVPTVQKVGAVIVYT